MLYLKARTPSCFAYGATRTRTIDDTSSPTSTTFLFGMERPSSFAPEPERACGRGLLRLERV